MPQQTSASDFTRYKNLSTQLASTVYSAKPNPHLAVPLITSLQDPIKLSTFLPTQANTTKHYVGNGKVQTWHR